MNAALAIPALMVAALLIFAACTLRREDHRQQDSLVLYGLHGERLLLLENGDEYELVPLDSP